MAREGVSGAAPARAELEFALCKESRRDTCLGTHVPGCPLPILPTLTPFALAAGRSLMLRFIGPNPPATSSPMKEPASRNVPAMWPAGRRRPYFTGSPETCHLVPRGRKVGVGFRTAEGALMYPPPSPNPRELRKEGKGRWERNTHKT